MVYQRLNHIGQDTRGFQLVFVILLGFWCILSNKAKNFVPNSIGATGVATDFPFLAIRTADFENDGIVWVIGERKSISQNEFRVRFSSVVVEEFLAWNSRIVKD